MRQQDPNTGDIRIVWSDIYKNVPAQIEPMSAKDYFAAQAIQSEATTKITVRWRPSLEATQRIVHVVKGVTTIYNPTRPIPDRNSGLDSVTIYATAGVNEGA